MNSSEFNRKFQSIGERLFLCIGNHEYNSTEKLSWAQIHTLINSRAEKYMDDLDTFGDYYFDNKATKTRYIFMGCSIRGTADVMMDNAQIAWFLRTLQTVPENYSIILFIHRILKFTFDTDDEEIVVSPSEDGAYIVNGINAYVGRTTYTYDGNVYDYSNATGTFICVFTGHSHYDAYYEAAVPIIMTTTDCCPKRHTGYDWQNETWEYDSVPGTVDEQAFDVVTIDKLNRKIYCTRIGYGTDRVFEY